MCGIIAVVHRRSTRPLPQAAEVTGLLDDALAAITADGLNLADAATAAERANELLRGVPGVRALIETAGLADQVDSRAAAIEDAVGSFERAADAGELDLSAEALEAFNASLIRVKDAAWAVRRDRLRTARAVADLSGTEPSAAALEAFTSVQVALSALDRLEVRGRDSAGLHLLVTNHGLDLSSPDIATELAQRADDPLFTSQAVRTPGGALSFVYKAAAEIGELGDNTRVLRDAISGDGLLRRALRADTAEVAVLGHTRWASVGVISEANAHPLNSEEADGREQPYCVAALNGDVDNYAELRDEAGLRIHPDVTTDAKVIPTLMARRLADGAGLDEAFRETVRRFDGSVAIAAAAADHPGKLLLALRGSGQALYVGLADDSFVVASEPYGVVEETSRYLRMDGEVAGPSGENGQVVVLDTASAGEVTGISRLAYDGTEDPVVDDDLATAGITTRDIDRGDFPHFLLKEISESPLSLRKTLRGRLEHRDGKLRARLGEDSIPPDVRKKLASGGYKRIIAIGQGTAAIAADAAAAAFKDTLADVDVAISSTTATELSGFALDDDMSDCLVVAISQSGTTTDTNRTVDLVKARGASVIAIVNRRNSDLTDRAHGVVYTSDGRDVEMAVPSTKAFYMQVAAGFVLAAALADVAGVAAEGTSELLEALRELPAAMETVLERRDEIGQAAHSYGPPRRYWAVVGNGANRIAAAEVRIKLSELCYKAIAFDATEDKKHIDLSSEPLILVCAAGLTGPTAEDVAKEVAIYRAHKAAPIVVASEGTSFPAALVTLEVPAVHPDLAFVLSTMVGHLFGYEAALAIDAQARPLREARAAVIDAALHDGAAPELLEHLRGQLEPIAARFFDALREGSYNGHLEASTAVRLVSLLRYALGVVPLETYSIDYGRIGTPSVVAEDLTAALTDAIDELTRTIDTIKHQAKTVTVGISRSEDELMSSPLVRAVVNAGASREHLTYKVLRTLAALGPAVDEVAGFTRYRIDGGADIETATIHVVEKGGVAADIPSRTDKDPTLRGTKRRAAFEREVTVARGRADDRTVILVPEAKDGEVSGLTLLQVRFADRLEASVFAEVLKGYRGRYGAIADAVTETEPTFRQEVLGELDVAEVLTVPVHLLADRWK